MQNPLDPGKWLSYLKHLTLVLINYSVVNNMTFMNLNVVNDVAVTSFNDQSIPYIV